MSKDETKKIINPEKNKIEESQEEQPSVIESDVIEFRGKTEEISDGYDNYIEMVSPSENGIEDSVGAQELFNQRLLTKELGDIMTNEKVRGSIDRMIDGTNFNDAMAIAKMISEGMLYMDEIKDKISDRFKKYIPEKLGSPEFIEENMKVFVFAAVLHDLGKGETSAIAKGYDEKSLPFPFPPIYRRELNPKLEPVFDVRRKMWKLEDQIKALKNKEKKDGELGEEDQETLKQMKEELEAVKIEEAEIAKDFVPELEEQDKLVASIEATINKFIPKNPNRSVNYRDLWNMHNRSAVIQVFESWGYDVYMNGDVIDWEKTINGFKETAKDNQDFSAEQQKIIVSIVGDHHVTQGAAILEDSGREQFDYRVVNKKLTDQSFYSAFSEVIDKIDAMLIRGPIPDATKGEVAKIVESASEFELMQGFLGHEFEGNVQQGVLNIINQESYFQFFKPVKKDGKKFDPPVLGKVLAILSTPSDLHGGKSNLMKSIALEDKVKSTEDKVEYKKYMGLRKELSAEISNILLEQFESGVLDTKKLDDLIVETQSAIGSGGDEKLTYKLELLKSAKENLEKLYEVHQHQEIKDFTREVAKAVFSQPGYAEKVVKIVAEKLKTIQAKKKKAA